MDHIAVKNGRYNGHVFQLRGKSGKVYDVYLIPEGIEDYSYMKDGKEVRGSQFRFKMEFPKRKSSKKQ